MPRLPHRKYAALIKRFYKHSQAVSDIEEQLKSMVEHHCPEKIKVNDWSDGICEAFYHDDIVDRVGRFPPTLAEALKQVAETQFCADEEVASEE